MTNSKLTKRALLGSSMSLLLCFAMLLGTTFAWFTDSAVSANNVITAGNLDVEVQYTLDGTTWNNLDGASNLFQKALWEPGHTEVVALKIDNVGSLALKYSAVMNLISEEIGLTKDGKDIVLSEILTVASHTTESDADVDAAFSKEDGLTYDYKTTFKAANVLGDADSEILPAGASKYVIIKVDMAETVGNEANHDGTNIPEITFGINVYATQLTSEEDSFGNQYDAGADYYIHVNPENVQAAIHEAKPGDVLYLDAGTYGNLVLENADGTPKNGITLAHDRPGQNSISNPFSVGQINLNSSENITIKGLYFDITKAQTVYGKSGATDYVASITGAKNGANTGAKNIVIDNCRFAGTSAAPANYAAICFEEQGRPTSRATNITVKNCYMDKAAFNFVRMNYMAAGTITIENNSIIATTEHNALNFTGNGADLIIKGNTFGRNSLVPANGWNPEKSAIGTSRQGTRNIKVVITGNTFINTLGTEGLVLDLKASYTADNTTLDFSGNTFLGGLAGLTEETVPSNKI